MPLFTIYIYLLMPDVQISKLFNCNSYGVPTIGKFIEKADVNLFVNTLVLRDSNKIE